MENPYDLKNILSGFDDEVMGAIQSNPKATPAQIAAQLKKSTAARVQAGFNAGKLQAGAGAPAGKMAPIDNVNYKVQKSKITIPIATTTFDVSPDIQPLTSYKQVVGVSISPLTATPPADWQVIMNVQGNQLIELGSAYDFIFNGAAPLDQRFFPMLFSTEQAVTVQLKFDVATVAAFSFYLNFLLRR